MGTTGQSCVDFRTLVKAKPPSTTKLLVRSSAAALAMATLLPATQAWAQEAEVSPAMEGATQDEAIVVTGSRIARTTFDTSTPVTVIGADTIAALGQVNLGETIQLLPQNVSTVSDTNVGIATNSAQTNIGAQIANLRGLNPANGVRTLTLIDGRRHVPSTTGGGVDMNLIPSILVQSVETVTGGASAAYGTDALAGVVNIILDKRLQGIKAQIDYGETFRSDGTSFHAALAGGTGFAGGRGHIVVAGEYQDNGDVGDCVYVREWCARSPDTFINEQWNKPGTANFGQPHYIRGDNGSVSNSSRTGVLRGNTSGRFNDVALKNITFTPDGTQAIDFEPGNYTQANGLADRQGGDCPIDCSQWSGLQLRPEVERWSTFLHADYEVSDSVKAVFEASYAARKSNVKGLSQGPGSGNPIRGDNFYLQNVTWLDRNTGEVIPFTDLIDSTRTGPFGVGGSSATATNVSQAPGVDNLPLFIGRNMNGTPGARSHYFTDLTSWRVMAGLEGELGILGGWKWDAYYQYGKTEQTLEISGLRINEFFSAAIDAVEDPNNPGQPICRGLLDGPPNSATPSGFFQHYNLPYAEGCVPLSLIGEGYDPAAIAYAYRTAREDFSYQQHVVALNLSGNLFEGWAGPIALALGGEYRFEKGEAIHNKMPFNIPFNVNAFGNDYAGDLKILEGYVEANVPLLRDLPLINYLELNGAFRRTQQTNTSGTTGQSKDLGFNTWKLSGNWEVTDWLRLRATRSRDVRAASFVDLYYNLGRTNFGPTAGRANNPWATGNTTGVDDWAEILYPPNFELNPEVGDTFTAGVVLQPGGPFEGLRLSVDYYDIQIKDAIVVLTAQETVNACYVAELACDAIFTGLNGEGQSFAELSDAQRTALGQLVLQGSGEVGAGFDSIRRGNANVGKFSTSGWDIEAVYRLPLDKLGDTMPGVLTLRGLATITNEMVVDLLGTGATETDYINQTGGTAFGGFAAPPEYVLTGYLTYDVGGFSITGDVKHIPEGIYDIRRCDVSRNECAASDVNSINDNYVEARTYFGLSTSYEFELAGTSTAEVFLSVRNLFDTDPPPTVSTNSGNDGPVMGGGGPTNPVYYDTIGARWRAGMRVKF